METLYTCPTCGKSFKLKAYLTENLKVHRRERPHSCHASELIGHEEIPSRLVSHSSIFVDNIARDEGLSTARSTSPEVSDPALHFSETPYIINIKQEEQD